MPKQTVLIPRTYPRSERWQDGTVELRLLTPEDKDAILDLAAGLDEQDMRYLRMDITNPQVVDEWIHNVEQGRTVTVLAEQAGELLGYGSLHHNELMWSSHMGEVRILVKSGFRGKGLARLLLNELIQFGAAMHLERLIAQIPAERPTVRRMLEQHGFQPEALLPEWLQTRDGTLHDLFIMTYRLHE